jgi:hypothetical protein
MPHPVRQYHCHFRPILVTVRPEGYLGELATWDKAEAALTEALNSTGLQWTINEADGAFYGPKIDITGEGRRVSFSVCGLTRAHVCVCVFFRRQDGWCVCVWVCVCACVRRVWHG